MPCGSTWDGMASRTMSRTVISFNVAAWAGRFTNCERRLCSRASRFMPSSSTAEWASVRVWAAGYTGTMVCTASENSGALKRAFRVRVPTGTVTRKRWHTEAPGCTVTGTICELTGWPGSESTRTMVPETGLSLMLDTVTAASYTSPSYRKRGSTRLTFTGSDTTISRSTSALCMAASCAYART